MKVGRKPKYDFWITEDGLTLISGWTRRGLTKEEVAGNIGINPATLYDWIKQFPELDNALKITKDIADCLVENALFKNATGYYYEEEIIIDGSKVSVRKFQKADTTAQIYWTKNRNSTDWRDRTVIDANVNQTPPVIADDSKDD
jgi:transposase-like protein